jgi:RNA polymerase sigma factor (sigma-70 family)
MEFFAIGEGIHFLNTPIGQSGNVDIAALLRAWGQGDSAALDQPRHSPPGGWEPLDHSSAVDLDAIPDLGSQNDREAVALDDALNALEKIDPRKVRVIELRFFAGLTAEETASVLGVSPNTVLRDWNLAKSWLLREMSVNTGE